jgi:hypothetical protein
LSLSGGDFGNYTVSHHTNRAGKMNITVTKEEHWYALKSNRPTGREYGFGVFEDDKLIGAITVNSLGRKIWSAISVEDGVFVKSLEFQTKEDAIEFITGKVER